MLPLLAVALLCQDEALPVELGYRDGLRFRARDGSWAGYLNGFIRIHGRTIFDRPDDDLPPLRTVPDSVFFRQARLETGGTFAGDWGYRLQADFGSGTVDQETGAAASSSAVRLRDAWVEWRRFPWFMVRFGQYFEPYSGEEMSTARHLEFAERSPLVRLTPGREQGLQVHGTLGDGLLRYFAMLSNGGALVNDDGRSVPDSNDEKELSGIVFLEPIEGLRLGAGGSMGDVDDVDAGDFHQTSPELSVLWLDPTAGTFDGLRRRGDLSLRLNRGPWQFRTEGLWRDDELRGSPERRLESRAVLATLSCLLTGEEKRADERVTPFSDWGALELAARACRVDFFNAPEAGLATPADAERLTTFTFATTWWVGRHFRLSADLVHERYGRGIDVGGQDVDFLTGLLFRAQIDF